MKRVGNLLDDLILVTGRHQDHRFRPWAKRVDAVDTNLTNGYCFVGPFIGDGTVEYEVKRTVYIVKTSEGSRKYQTEHYTVVVMDSDGNLALPGLHTTDATRGWALRLREAVKALLESQDK